ncbi:hypothetical protein QVD99_002416 [Batrachochytrium dendrobatidis]|nr:hypothetical protein O5D80_006644 [Batrachochytrium dendrobatidis]KAK5670636.1 hypothetical protein QVD99_002416 [Batrachochytrium dendrobatidis]
MDTVVNDTMNNPIETAVVEDTINEPMETTTENDVQLKSTSTHHVLESFDLFDGNNELISEYMTRKTEISASHSQYINEHPELKAFMSDYLQFLLHRKPQDVYQFTLEYYQP